MRKIVAHVFFLCFKIAQVAGFISTLGQFVVAVVVFFPIIDSATLIFSLELFLPHKRVSMRYTTTQVYRTIVFALSRRKLCNNKECSTAVTLG